MGSALGLTVVVVSNLFGCQDYLFEQKCREVTKEAEIKQPVVRATPADILFVVDNSGSMADEQENLAVNFNAFIRNIADTGDYRIAVVTTDLTSRTDPATHQNTVVTELGGTVNSSYDATTPREWISDNRSGCVEIPDINHGCFRGPVAAERLVTSAMTPEDQNRVFTSNVNVGSCGSGTEEGLAGMITALQKTSTGGCNEGFLRDAANLVVVIVSDEDDSSPQTVSSYVDALAEMKPGGYSQIRVAAIVSSVDGQATNCRVQTQGTPSADCGSVCDGCPDDCLSNPAQSKCALWCSTIRKREFYNLYCDWCSYFNADGCCSARSGNRYIDFAHQVEQRVVAADPAISATQCQGSGEGAIACLTDSICQTSFATTLERIATELVKSTSFTLDPPASFPEGVRVIMSNGRFPAEGKELVYGTDFTVSADGRILRLVGANAPQEGEDIDIQFVVEREEGTGEARGACPD